MKEFVCIVCPNSCRLTVSEENGEITVSGNECNRGVEYGLSEYCNPRRMLTTTVAISGAVLPRLPVISTAEIPKNKLKRCLEQLYSTAVTAPVQSGDIVLRDICRTGVDIAASRSIYRKNDRESDEEAGR
ncbi:MAG: DUF1667 domain-containing protein [Firmicutes bacterium]|nr:DUF1667 domain-containing protein [Bacillota bacterium]